MSDRALVALDSVKGNYAQFTGWYEEDMMEKMEEDHTLLLEVQRALSEGEFVFYAQPKCNIATGKIVGLESLARWMHPERGVIPPARFMPVLERNGLVTALDLHIWEQVCRALRSWIDAGRTAVPVSYTHLDVYKRQEVVYARLSAAGAVDNVYVVNVLKPNAPGTVVDYGPYTAVQNLTDASGIEQQGDAVSVDVAGDSLSYQGDLGAAALPWGVSVTYELDGKRVDATDLGGASGKLAIIVTTKKDASVCLLYTSRCV